MGVVCSVWGMDTPNQQQMTAWRTLEACLIPPMTIFTAPVSPAGDRCGLGFHDGI